MIIYAIKRKRDKQSQEAILNAITQKHNKSHRQVLLFKKVKYCDCSMAHHCGSYSSERTKFVQDK